MASVPNKKNIDFDVYEKANPASQIDWAKQAADITKVFTDIRDERDTRKAEIEKSYTDQQQTLTEIGEYDNPTIQQFVMNGAQDASNKLQDFHNLVKRGLAKPADYKRFQMNQKNGFNLVKRNAEQYDKRFQEYTKMVEDGTAGVGDEWMAKQLEGFANMNNMTLQSDAETGNMVMLRIDPETGQPIPGESMSVNRMNLMMKQNFGSFDVGEAVTGVKDEIGSIITASITATGVETDEITTEMRSRAETEFFSTEKGMETLTLKAEQMLANKNHKLDLLGRNVKTKDGEKYRPGSQEEYDEFAKNNPGKENPIIVMEFGKDNVYQPKFDENQDKAALDYAKKQITSALDVKQEVDVKKTKTRKPPNKPTESDRREGRRKREIQSLGNNLNLLMTGNKKERDAAARNLRQANPNLQEVGVIEGPDGMPTHLVIRKKGDVREPIPISVDGTLMIPEETARKVWNDFGFTYGDDDISIDEFFNYGGSFGDEYGQGYGNISSVEERKALNYKRGLKIPTDDGEEVSAKEFLGLDDIFRKDGDGARKSAYMKLLDNEYFWPKGLNVKKDIEVKDGNFIVYIGEQEPIEFPNENSTKHADVIAAIEDAIAAEVGLWNEGSSSGGRASQFNDDQDDNK